MNSSNKRGGGPPHIATFHGRTFEIYEVASAKELSPILRDNIRRIVDYLYDDEAADYTYWDSDKPLGNHFFCSVWAFKCWLYYYSF
jgi:hypothetical protein